MVCYDMGIMTAVWMIARGASAAMGLFHRTVAKQDSI